MRQVTAAALLDRLERVRACGHGRWRAWCPACESSREVLAITETGDGTVLVHCFRSGCSVTSIADAAGIDLADLFPTSSPDVHASTPVKRRFNAAQVIEVVNVELIEILIIVGAILRRGSVTPTENERLRLSISRVSAAEGATHGR